MRHDGAMRRASTLGRLLFLLLPIAATPLLAMAACSSSQTTPGGGGDASVADARLDTDTSVADTRADDTSADGDRTKDSTSSDADAGAAPDDAATCAFGDAMPDVGRGPLCTPAAKAQRWAAMIQQPIQLANRAAGLSLSGAADAGLTLAQAEAIDCQSDDQGDLFGDCTRVASWGDSSEAWMNYDPTTGVGRFFVLWPGYLGALDFKSPDAATTYSIGVNRQITKNGQPFTLDTGWSGAAFEAEVDELYRGIVSTFAPTIALAPPGTTCASTHACKIGRFGAVGFVFIPAVGFALWVSDATAAQPSPSIPNRLDVNRL
jgi:hypothetical protein